MHKIEQQIKPIPPLVIGDNKPQKNFKMFTLWAEIGERVLGALYINWKIGKGK